MTNDSWPTHKPSPFYDDEEQDGIRTRSLCDFGTEMSFDGRVCVRWCVGVDVFVCVLDCLRFILKCLLGQ